jgi:tRNA pseudouridine55 synthase
MRGILPVIKPKNYTSHDIVYFIRKKFNLKKTGHTGTLDPMAEGLLLVCINEAVKISAILIGQDKEYIAQILFGKITDTDDITGKVIKEKKEIDLKENEIKEVLKKFLGNILQRPPNYSAISIDGKRLYKYALANQEIKKIIRPVQIKELEFLEFKNNILSIRILCSSGTYIRSLARDLGENLGCGGTLYSLLRTKIGNFNLEHAIDFNDLSKFDIDKLNKKLITMEDIVKNKKIVNINEYEAKKIYNGNTTFRDFSDIVNEEEIFFEYSGKIIATGKITDSKLKFTNVFNNTIEEMKILSTKS